MLTVSSSVTPSTSAKSPQCTALRRLHRPQSAERRPEGFHTAEDNISLCVQLTDHRCRQRQDGTAEHPPKTLRIWTQDAIAAFGHLQGTLNVSLRGQRAGDGNEHTVIHQPSMALLPFRYRYPLRHKAPAASSGRLTHNTGHKCNTALFRP